jgi:hypothetical protein
MLDIYESHILLYHSSQIGRTHFKFHHIKLICKFIIYYSIDIAAYQIPSYYEKKDHSF